MRRSIVRVTILIIAVFITAGSLFAQVDADTKAEQLILNQLKERDEQVKKVMGPKGTSYSDEQKANLKELINDIIYFEHMAQIALEETYSEINAEKREEFVNLFATIIRDQSLAKLDIYRADVSYEKIDVTADSAYVKTIAKLENVTTPVAYEMVKVGDQWLIGDMIIDDVSTAESYKRSFQSIIKRKGFDVLLNSLRKRANRS